MDIVFMIFGSGYDARNLELSRRNGIGPAIWLSARQRVRACPGDGTSRIAWIRRMVTGVVVYWFALRAPGS
jgi:hypothetical protein